ncbi:MAG: phage protein Gp36 family protein [Bacteroidota bacterium]
MPADRYATQDQMVDLFGEADLVLMTGGDGAIDQDKLGAAINAAQAEADGYVGSVLPLPLERIPDVLRLHACNIAYWYLDVDNPTEGATTRYRAAIRFLERVQDGKASLGVADDGDAVLPSGGVTVSAPDRVFSNDKLKRFTG